MSGKSLGWEEKIFFKCFAFPRKTFEFSRKYICVLSQNQLSLDKLFLFTLQLAVIHTARMFTMERFIEFYFELGLNKVIQSVLRSRHGFWTF